MLFSPNAYLIVKGSLDITGRIDSPVSIKAINERWKGIYVYDSEETSTWKHLVIEQINELQDGVLSLTGGITFYKSNIHMDNVTIKSAHGEDALNIVESEINLSNIFIDNTFSDAIDLDFSHGVINNLHIQNAGGDGLDLSGSKVNVTLYSAENILDKALSAGESSEASLKNSKFRDIGIGIASKDGSIVKAENIQIDDVALYSAIAFQKKGFLWPCKFKLKEFKLKFPSSHCL